MPSDILFIIKFYKRPTSGPHYPYTGIHKPKNINPITKPKGKKRDATLHHTPQTHIAHVLKPQPLEDAWPVMKLRHLNRVEITTGAVDRSFTGIANHRHLSQIEVEAVNLRDTTIGNTGTNLRPPNSTPNDSIGGKGICV